MDPLRLLRKEYEKDKRQKETIKERYKREALKVFDLTEILTEVLSKLVIKKLKESCRLSNQNKAEIDNRVSALILEITRRDMLGLLDRIERKEFFRTSCEDRKILQELLK